MDAVQRHAKLAQIAASDPRSELADLITEVRDLRAEIDGRLITNHPSTMTQVREILVQCGKLSAARAVFRTVGGSSDGWRNFLASTINHAAAAAMANWSMKQWDDFIRDDYIGHEPLREFESNTSDSAAKRDWRTLG